MLVVVSFIAVVLYVIAAYGLTKRLTAYQQTDTTSHKIILIGLVAAILHGFVLVQALLPSVGINLGFTNVLSLATVFIALLLIFTSFNKPIENLGIIVFPLSALVLSIQVLLPTEHLLNPAETKGLGIHIVLSILAYSILGLAAVQAVLLSLQERNLHNRKPGGIIRALPPMETMEQLLFQMIIIGFSLQSMSLVSGFTYLENMFSQHIVHKTVLSAIAWGVFAILLWGHWKYGWRGRTAVRWTISGFLTLLIAYFGSKYVIEVLLER